MAGAMAGGIASAELVIALARAGFLASYGAAGQLPESIGKALARFAEEIPGLPYAVNLIHSPSEEALERQAVELFLRYGVRCVEASAFMGLTPHVVRYRLSGLTTDAQGLPVAGHRLVAKVSRTEIAERFMRPAPAEMVSALLDQALITAEQADLAKYLPMADDITVEADSGGHTDHAAAGRAAAQRAQAGQDRAERAPLPGAGPGRRGRMGSAPRSRWPPPSPWARPMW